MVRGGTGKPDANVFSQLILSLQLLVFFVCDSVLLPLLIFTFSFPSFMFFVSTTPVVQEITKTKNDDGRVKVIVEVAILGSTEIEEE